MKNVNSKEKVVIIGGGIAGLSAGVYALMAGEVIKDLANVKNL